MKESKKQLRKMLQKPQISKKVKKQLKEFDWGANVRAHQYSKLKHDRYDALALLTELVKESNYDWRVLTSQKQLINNLQTNRASLNFDLLSLDRLGMIHVDLTQLAKGQDHFSCEIIPHKVF